MKNRKLVVVAILLAGITSGTNAQSYFTSHPVEGPAHKAKIVQNYLACLSSVNEGTVESAMAQIAWLQLSNPNVDLAALKSQIDDLARKGSTPLIRYKAYLTGAVLDDVMLFQDVSRGSYNEPDEMYLAVSSRLSQTVLSAGQ